MWQPFHKFEHSNQGISWVSQGMSQKGDFLSFKVILESMSEPEHVPVLLSEQPEPFSILLWNSEC